MKKTFQLTQTGIKPERVLEAIKHEIRQYLKRERRKALPEGADYWDFDCQLGLSLEQATPTHLANVIAGVDELARQGAASFYLVLSAKPAVRQRTTPQAGPEGGPDAESEPV